MATKRKGPLIRDVELMGHHKHCQWSLLEVPKDDALFLVCTCRELDYDDWIAAGEAEYDRRKSGDTATWPYEL
jgi:hypothetical protein